LNKKERSKKWRQENPEKVRAYKKSYRLTHLVKEREQRRKYRLKHPEKVQKWNGKRHRRIREALDAHFSKVCFFCGIHHSIDLHEIHGRKHPTIDTWKGVQYILKHDEDFIPLCKFCHRGIHFCMAYLGLNWDMILELRIIA